MAEWAEDLFQVSIKGPGPYGFRLYGGDGDPLIVAKLRARSKAHDAGLREGDAVLGINGRSCQTVSHGVAMTLLETADDLLHLHLYRGSTSRKTIAAVYDAIGNQLRPVSPGTAPPNRSSAPATATAADQPTPSAAETIDSAAPPSTVEKDAPTRNENVTSHPRQEVTSYPRQEVTSYPRQEVTSYPRQEVTSYSQQEVTSSIGTGVTQKTTRETEDRGGVTVTKVTRELTIGGGPIAAIAAPAEGESGVKGHRSTTVLFHSVPKQATKVQPMRWTPSGVGTKEEEHSPAIRLQGKENLPPNKTRDLLGELGGVGQPQQQQFKVYKTTAKLLMWQPSDVPSLPVREPSPAMTFEVLETREFQPRPQKEEKGSRPPRHSDAVDGTDGSDPFGLSPQLFHVLTTEASYDEDLILGRKKKIFADSSFYDDPEQKYPTIEEQIKMARRVALSLSAPDNVTARGQRMFMKRKEKANHWSTDQSLDGLNPYVATGPPGKARPQRLKTARKDLFYNPTPWSAAASSGEKVVTEAIRETLDGYPDDGEQNSGSFARSRALFEKRVDREGGGGGGELPWKKAHHGSGGPAGAQLYAGLVNDLRGMKGKGAKLFAQKRARALEEEEEDEEEQEEVAAGGWQSEGEAAVGGPRERGGGGEEYEAQERSIDVEDAPSARRRPEEPGSGSTRPSYPWESKAVLTPWRTIGAAAAAKDAASEQQRRARAAGRPDDAWLQKTTAEDIPGFIAQKTPSTSYRPVRFHLPSNGPGPGITDF